MLLRYSWRTAAALLLTGLLACSKKEVQPEQTALASYQLNSRQISCRPALSHHIDTGYDFLELKLTTTPQPTTGPETLALYFYKPVGAPASAYELSDMIFDDSNQLRKQNFHPTAVSLLPASSGSFSGTFTGETCVACGFNFQRTYVVSNGTFTNVQP